MKILTLLMVFVMLLSIPSVSAKEVANKELKESEYGTLGHWFKIGDRLYIEKYIDGTSREVFERTSIFSFLKKATIVEGGYDTLWATEGSSVPVNIRIQGINLPTFCGTNCGQGANTHHRYEMYDNGVYRSIGIWEFDAPIPYPLRPSPNVPVTMNIPGETAGKRNFAIKECVQTADKSRYICGSESLSSDTNFDVIWTQGTQAATPTAYGTAAPTSTPINPGYTPSAKPVILQIDSEPTNADVQLSGAGIGKTPILLTVYPDEGMKVLYITLSGYKTAMKAVSATSENPLLVTLVPLVLTPITTPQIATTPPVGSQTKYQCSNGQWVTDTSLCPIPSQTTPQQTSGMTLETGTATRTPPPVPTPYDTPAFEAVFAIVGLLAVAYLVLRQKPPKEHNEID